jgi:hypothetical protein
MPLNYGSKLMPSLMCMAFALIAFLSVSPATGAPFHGLSNLLDDSAQVVRRPGGIDQPIDYKAADSILFDVQNRQVHLYRDAFLHYGTIELKAYYIRVDLAKQEIFAKGAPDSTGRYAYRPILKDGDDEYSADSMVYNSKSKKGKVYGLRLVEDDAVVHCNQVFRNADGSFLADRGKLTTCQDPHPHFYLDARKLKVIPDKKVIFGPANLVVEDLPTPLALPFGLVPTKKGRRNGILFPSYGYQQNRGGFYLENLGYYTGLGDNKDLTLTGAVFFNGDYRLAAASRYVKRYRYDGSLNIGTSTFSQGEKTSNTFFRQRDFNVQWRYNMHPNVRPGTRFAAQVDMGTPGFKRLNSNDPNAIVQSQFNSSVSYGKTFLNNRFNLNAAMTHSQNTGNRTINFDLPSISLNMQRWQPFLKKGQSADNWIKLLNLTYSMDIQNRMATSDSILFSPRYRESFEQLRNGVRHQIPLSTTIKLSKGRINLSPAANYTEWWYNKTQRRYWDDNERTVRDSSVQGFSRAMGYSASLSASTNIYGTFTGLKWGAIKALRHVITPTASLNYRPDFSSNRFKYFNDVQIDSAGRTQRYSIYGNGVFGGPGAGKEGSLNLNVTQVLMAKVMKRGDSAVKTSTNVNLIDNLRAGMAYNFMADSFQLSDLSISLNTRLLSLIGLQFDGRWDPYIRNAQGRPINRLEISENGRLLRFSQFRLSMNAGLSPQVLKGKKTPAQAARRDRYTEGEWFEWQNRMGDFYDFNIPWSLSLNYNFMLNKSGLMPQVNNVVNISGDVNLTPQWKIGYNTGYILNQKAFSFSQYTVTRDLHCWQISFQWIPDGIRKSWFFTLSPKSGMLQDMKLNKRVWWNEIR